MMADCVPIRLNVLDEPILIRCRQCSSSALLSIAVACSEGWDEFQEEEQEDESLTVYLGICPECERNRWRPNSPR